MKQKKLEVSEAIINNLKLEMDEYNIELSNIKQENIVINSDNVKYKEILQKKGNELANCNNKIINYENIIKANKSE